MPQVSINLFSVVLAAAASMILGFVWYSTPVFGARWMKETGKTKEDVGQPGPGYAAIVVVALFTAYVLAHFVQYTGAVTPMDGAKTGLWIGLGFVATAMGADAVFGGKSRALYLITAGYQVVSLMIMGAILANFV